MTDTTAERVPLGTIVIYGLPSAGIGFMFFLAAFLSAGGTRGLSGFFSSAPTTEIDSIITAALTPKNLDKYPITLPPLC